VKFEPFDFACPECDERGCPECGVRGSFTVDVCPLAFAGREIFEVLFYADLFKRGLPPVAGGALDQSAWFTQAAHFAWAEASRFRTPEAALMAAAGAGEGN